MQSDERMPFVCHPTAPSSSENEFRGNILPQQQWQQHQNAFGMAKRATATEHQMQSVKQTLKQTSQKMNYQWTVAFSN
jgi:hypothetical protein